MDTIISGTSGLIGGALNARLSSRFNVRTTGRSGQNDIHIDFSSGESITQADLGEAEAFIHCAGVNDNDFEEGIETGYAKGTTLFSTLVEKLKDAGIQRLVYFSSAHVYGKLRGTIDENTCANPLSDYGLAHFCSEQILKRSANGLRVMVIRPNAVFGVPNDLSTFRRWYLIPYAFPKSCVEEQRIVLRSHGEQKRNFVSTGDLTRYIRHYLEQPEPSPFTLMNARGRETLSIYKFARRCCSIYEKLTGESCDVERPESAETADPVDFSYETQLHDYRPQEELDAYLETFTKALIERQN